jgi:hypothetical protein
MAHFIGYELDILLSVQKRQAEGPACRSREPKVRRDRTDQNPRVLQSRHGNRFRLS